MSYCRWSDNDFQCDVYVYQDASFGGWTVMVAGGHPLFREKLPPRVHLPTGFSETEEGKQIFHAWIERRKTVSRLLEEAARITFKLPYAGAILRTETPGECADLLLELRGYGYQVPQYAIEELRADQEENKINPPPPEFYELLHELRDYKDDATS